MATITSTAFGNDSGVSSTSVSTNAGTGGNQNLNVSAGQPIGGSYESQNGGVVTTVQDTIGNSYVVLTPETTFGPTVVCFYCASSIGSNANNVITVNLSVAVAVKGVQAFTGTGFDTAALLLDSKNNNAASATSIGPVSPLACGTSDALIYAANISSNDREFDQTSGCIEVDDIGAATKLARSGQSQYKFTTGGGNQSITSTVTGGVASNLQTAQMAFKTLPPGPAIDAQPTDQATTLGGTATFSISSSTATSYQWQDNRSGAFANVPDGTGATTASYTTAATAAGFQGRQYLCIASSVGGSTTSSSARLTISDLPVYLWSTAVQAGNDVWLRDPASFSAGGGAVVGLGAETDSAFTLGSARPAGVCTETDAALALAGVQVRAVGLVNETDSALAQAALQIRTIGLAAETDSALATAGIQLRLTGQSAEADSALVLAAVLSRAVGTAVETESALALLPGANGAVGLASEADTALPRGSARPAVAAIEADTALPLSGIAVRATGLATEVDSAFAAAVARPVGLASETDTALPLAANVNGSVGLAAEVDTALPRGVARPAGLATEADTALARAAAQIRAAGLAVEADTAFALAPSAGSSVGIASEADTALPRGSARPVGLATETEVALGLAGRLIRSAGLAAEADVALALVAIQRSAAGRADELDSALQLFAPGSLLVGLAIESDTAFSLQRAVLPTWSSGGTARIGGTPLPAEGDRIGAGTLGDGGGRIGGSPLSKRTRRIG